MAAGCGAVAAAAAIARPGGRAIRATRR
jgi:hypothetical protein